MPLNFKSCFGILLSLFATFLIGCGASESEYAGSSYIYTNSAGTSTFLQAGSPQYLAVDRSQTDLNVLLPVSRIIGLNEFDALVEPDLSPDKAAANSVVTGIGIEARDHSGHALQIRLGVIAREFNPTTGRFGTTTRIFSAPGEDLGASQIYQSSTTNTFLTGMGVRLREGDVTLLQLQRKSLDRLGRSGVGLSASKSVVLDNNWAAVGFIIRFVPNSPQDRVPFLQDTLLYPADLVTR